MSMLRRVRLACEDTGRHVRALWEGWGLSRKRRADRRALRGAHRQIGKAAASAGLETERTRYGNVLESKAALALRQVALDRKRAAETEARSALEERRREGKARIAGLRAERDRLDEAHGSARKDRARAEDSIRDLERDLALPPEKREGRPPRESLEPKLTTLRDSLPHLRSTEDSARAALDAKQQELRSTKRTFSEDEDRLEDALRAAESAVRDAEREIAAAQTVLDGSHEQLGRALHESGAENPATAGVLGRAREIQARIESGAEQIRVRRRVVEETRRPARIVMLGGAGSLLLLVVVIGLLTDGDGEPAPESPPRAERAEPAPARPPAGPPAADDLRKAILALPALATREVDGVTLFRPTGEVAVDSDEPAAGGGRRLRVRAGVERRLDPAGEPSSETLHLLVVLDAAGRVIRGETQGRTSPDDDELARLLEQW